MGDTKPPEEPATYLEFREIVESYKRTSYHTRTAFERCTRLVECKPVWNEVSFLERHKTFQDVLISQIQEYIVKGQPSLNRQSRKVEFNVTIFVIWERVLKRVFNMASGKTDYGSKLLEEAGPVRSEWIAIRRVISCLLDRGVVGVKILRYADIEQCELAEHLKFRRLGEFDLRSQTRLIGKRLTLIETVTDKIFDFAISMEKRLSGKLEMQMYHCQLCVSWEEMFRQYKRRLEDPLNARPPFIPPCSSSPSPSREPSPDGSETSTSEIQPMVPSGILQSPCPSPPLIGMPGIFNVDVDICSRSPTPEKSPVSVPSPAPLEIEETENDFIDPNPHDSSPPAIDTRSGSSQEDDPEIESFTSSCPPSPAGPRVKAEPGVDFHTKSRTPSPTPAAPPKIKTPPNNDQVDNILGNQTPPPPDPCHNSNSLLSYEPRNTKQQSPAGGASPSAQPSQQNTYSAATNEPEAVPENEAAQRAPSPSDEPAAKRGRYEEEIRVPQAQPYVAAPAVRPAAPAPAPAPAPEPEPEPPAPAPAPEPEPALPQQADDLDFNNEVDFNIEERVRSRASTTSPLQPHSPNTRFSANFHAKFRQVAQLTKGIPSPVQAHSPVQVHSPIRIHSPVHAQVPQQEDENAEIFQAALPPASPMQWDQQEEEPVQEQNWEAPSPANGHASFEVKEESAQKQDFEDQPSGTNGHATLEVEEETAQEQNWEVQSSSNGHATLEVEEASSAVDESAPSYDDPADCEPSTSGIPPNDSNGELAANSSSQNGRTIQKVAPMVASSSWIPRWMRPKLDNAYELLSEGKGIDDAWEKSKNIEPDEEEEQEPSPKKSSRKTPARKKTNRRGKKRDSEDEERQQYTRGNDVFEFQRSPSPKGPKDVKRRREEDERIKELLKEGAALLERREIEDPFHIPSPEVDESWRIDDDELNECYLLAGEPLPAGEEAPEAVMDPNLEVGAVEEVVAREFVEEEAPEEQMDLNLEAAAVEEVVEGEDMVYNIEDVVAEEDVVGGEDVEEEAPEEDTGANLEVAAVGVEAVEDEEPEEDIVHNIEDVVAEEDVVGGVDVEDEAPEALMNLNLDVAAEVVVGGEGVEEEGVKGEMVYNMEDVVEDEVPQEEGYNINDVVAEEVVIAEEEEKVEEEEEEEDEYIDVETVDDEVVGGYMNGAFDNGHGYSANGAGAVLQDYSNPTTATLQYASYSTPGSPTGTQQDSGFHGAQDFLTASNYSNPGDLATVPHDDADYGTHDDVATVSPQIYSILGDDLVAPSNPGCMALRNPLSPMKFEYHKPAEPLAPIVIAGPPAFPEDDSDDDDDDDDRLPDDWEDAFLEEGNDESESDGSDDEEEDDALKSEKASPEFDDDIIVIEDVENGSEGSDSDDDPQRRHDDDDSEIDAENPEDEDLEDVGGPGSPREAPEVVETDEEVNDEEEYEDSDVERDSEEDSDDDDDDVESQDGEFVPGVGHWDDDLGAMIYNEPIERQPEETFPLALIRGSDDDEEDVRPPARRHHVSTPSRRSSVGTDSSGSPITSTDPRSSRSASPEYDVRAALALLARRRIGRLVEEQVFDRPGAIPMVQQRPQNAAPEVVQDSLAVPNSDYQHHTPESYHSEYNSNPASPAHVTPPAILLRVPTEQMEPVQVSPDAIIHQNQSPEIDVVGVSPTTQSPEINVVGVSDEDDDSEIDVVGYSDDDNDPESPRADELDDSDEDERPVMPVYNVSDEDDVEEEEAPPSQPSTLKRRHPDDDDDDDVTTQRKVPNTNC